ncbi:hypothetical protein ACIRQF_07045 [Streptomyces sp. NPDC101191]|uniref:hypothetical protein n=1 Tax=Streptomyces sp. NPDC101191 TaxID=3366126 RepID=UPI00380D2398
MQDIEVSMQYMDEKDISPVQSDDLYHFTSRGDRQPPSWVAADIRAMTAEQRLQSILTTGLIRTFRPYSKQVRPEQKRCVCFTEAPISHLAWLMEKRRYEPYAIVMSRGQILGAGGGQVAYINCEMTLKAFDRAGLGHWVVPTGGQPDWTHEREWRMPWQHEQMPIPRLKAILVPDASWRPVPAGEPLPELWVKTPIRVWNPKKKLCTEYAPGKLA